MIKKQKELHLSNRKFAKYLGMGASTQLFPTFLGFAPDRTNIDWSIYIEKETYDPIAKTL